MSLCSQVCKAVCFCLASCVLANFLVKMAQPVGVVPYNGKNDFAIWKQKMKCVLIQQKVFKVVDGTLPDGTAQDKIDEMNELARATIVLNLSDSVIRKVDHEESAADMWKLLDTLYTETSMSSRMYLLEKLFKFKLDLAKDIDDNVDRFQKLVQDIKRSGDKTIDEYTSIALMNAIPDSYSDVKAAIKYGRDSAPLDLIISSLKSKELELRERAADKNAYNKVLNVRGRSKSRGGNEPSSGSGNSSNPRKKFRSRSRSKDPKTYRKCFNCGDVGHYKRECTKPKKNKFPNNNPQVETLVNVAAYDNVNDSVFMVHDLQFVNASPACPFTSNYRQRSV